METSKLAPENVPVHITTVIAQTEKNMAIQAPLTAVYIQTVPVLPAQFYPQLPSAVQEPSTLHVAMSPLHSKETLPFLNMDILGGLQSQLGLSLGVKPKSLGKHLCPHCGRDCMKPSVLEKHLRCHTGERPYPCTTCGVSFKTQSNLYKHRRTQAHARLSSESEHSNLGSLDSISNSREICTSSWSLEEHEEECIMEKNATLRATEKSTSVNTIKVYSMQMQGSVSDQKELSFRVLNGETNGKEIVIKEDDKQSMENPKPPITVSQHLPLQRQDAMLFSKTWNTFVSKGKSQSHESTDSGFSESTSHPSPGGALHDYSMDSFIESNKYHLEETTSASTCSERSHTGQDSKDTAREQKQKTLEERISKLISENTAVVENKQLEHVRPRKTVLSKQGSIDLPMPYTYKDSFHFDMRIRPAQNIGLQSHSKSGLYSSVSTQYSSRVEHAPLTHSNSLPFSVILPQPKRINLNSSYQGDYVRLTQGGRSGQINSTGFLMKPVNQQSSTHCPLVRQTALDCNHATDGIFMNSSVEEACTGGLSCNRNGNDIYGEPNTRKFRRKKVQKFAYNKWYMYGGGTFKKLYNTKKSGDNCTFSSSKYSTNPEHEVVHCQQKRVSVVRKEMVTPGLMINCTNSTATVDHHSTSLSLVSTVDCNLRDCLNSNSSIKAQPRRNVSLSVLPLPTTGTLVSHKLECLNRTEGRRLMNEEKHSESISQHLGTHISSYRKKLRTDDKIFSPLETETKQSTTRHPPFFDTVSVPPQCKNLHLINLQKNQRNTDLKGALFLPYSLNTNAQSVSTSAVTFIPSSVQSNFLPKYQLKLPNAPEHDFSASLPVEDKIKGTEGGTLTPIPSSSADQTAITSQKTCGNPITSLLMQTHDIKILNGFTSTQNQLFRPCTVTTLCGPKTSWSSQNLASGAAVVHRQFEASTITTSCFKEDKTGLCSTLNSMVDLVPQRLPRPLASTDVDLFLTTANNQTSATTLKAVSHQTFIINNSHLPHKQLSTASCLSNPGSHAYTDLNTVLHCPIVPSDHVQPPQNVFHMRTPDLQICLEIISDEQLALIEPQIEHLSRSTHVTKT